MHPPRILAARLLLPLVLLGSGGASNASDHQGDLGPADPDRRRLPIDWRPACDRYTGPAPALFKHYRGAIHDHTKYSDGDIHSTPADVYSAGFDNGLDFAVSTDHSDTLNDLLFISVGSDCFTSVTGLLSCLIPEHGDLNKWAATQQQAQADTTDAFLAGRGFEWTNDRAGHINVLFSSNFANAKLDPAYLSRDAVTHLYDWLRRDPVTPVAAGVSQIGGGADGIAIFNHPGDKCLRDDDAVCNWNRFEYVPEADRQMVGIELYNSGTSGDTPYKGRKDRYADYYMQALDHGWHVGAVGGEDMHDTTWTLPSHPKTVVLTETLSTDGIKQGMLQRRMYTLVSNLPGDDLVIDMDVAGHPMGDRLSCAADASVPLEVSVHTRDGLPFDGRLSLYDHADPEQPLADGPGDPLITVEGDRLSYALPVRDDKEHWFFVRVDNAEGESLAYTSPVWISARDGE